MTKRVIDLAKYALGQFVDMRGEHLDDGRIAPPTDLKAEIAEISSISDVLVVKHPHDICGLSFAIDAERYICFPVERVDPGDSAFFEAPDDFLRVELSGATLLYIIHQLGLSPSVASGDEVEERVVGPAKSEDGVGLEELMEFYPKLHIFHFKNSGIFKEDAPIDTISLYLATYHPEVTSRCQLNGETIEVVRDLILEEKPWMHKGNILDAMTASHLRHAFLEIYRCLEFAFVLPRAKELMQEIKLSGGSVTEDPIAFARMCAEKLGWRRIERDSIESIFRSVSQKDHENFFSAASSCSATKPSLVPPKQEAEKVNGTVSFVAQSYYNIRNQVAHQFWPHQMKAMNDDDWNSLIRLTAFCIKSYH